MTGRARIAWTRTDVRAPRQQVATGWRGRWQRARWQRARWQRARAWADVGLTAPRCAGFHTADDGANAARADRSATQVAPSARAAASVCQRQVERAEAAALTAGLEFDHDRYTAESGVGQPRAVARVRSQASDLVGHSP